MLRRKLGVDQRKALGLALTSGPDLARAPSAESLSDEEAKLVGKSGARSNRIDDDFEREEKDTPPTRSRSRKARSRVAFDDDGVSGLKLEKNLKTRDGSKSTSALKMPANRNEVSRGSSKSRPVSGVRRTPSANNRVFRDPGGGVGGQGTDSRLEAFEAKFDKYRANKKQREAIEKRAKLFEKPEYDVTTKNRKSPSKRAKKYTSVVGAEIDFKPSGKFDKDFLMPEGYEDHLLRSELLDTRKDPFKVLGVSPEDKMTFFLLKWVFDYIKQDSELEDEDLKGAAFVMKKDLVSQLSKNPELMNALGIASKRELHDGVQAAASAKKGCLTWQEMLNYFFLRNATL